MATKMILIVCDHEEYDKKHILQMITKARSLALSQNMQVSVLCIGPEDQTRYRNIASYGADHVYAVKEQISSISEYADACEAALDEIRPQVVLFPATAFGKAVAAIISTRFKAGLTADCIDIECTEEHEFHFLRSAMADSVIACIKCINCDMAMCTVKENVFVAEKCCEATSVDVIPIAYDVKEEYAEVKRFHKDVVEEQAEEVNLDKYDTVFGIGRGVGNKETVDRIVELAKLLNVGVACTRAVVEEGWLSSEYQIGQSGKSISPKLYIAFGISGACQHIVGVRNAKTIIAINDKNDEPIARYADFMIVADLHRIIEELETEAVSENSLMMVCK